MAKPQLQETHQPILLRFQYFTLEIGEINEFAFDYSYWSYDGLNEEANGYMKPQPGSNNTDQDMVFQDLGIQVLDNAFEGHHTFLFAYGQTKSGKSYSIVGYGQNKGIIPRASEEIFRRIKQMKPILRIIFNMKLLSGPRGEINVREHLKFGVYVENMSKVPVSSYDEIQIQIDVGTNNRTIGSTNMNVISSRAHTITPLTFKSIGDRLKEGSNINKSLMILGKVISTLTTKTKGSAVVVPYREFKLTFTLRNALGGNSKSAMIAALFPASVNFDETLSTLRYTRQVKCIKNEAKVNESPQEKLIRELKEENEKLNRIQLMGGGVLSILLCQRSLSKIRECLTKSSKKEKNIRNVLKKSMLIISVVTKRRKSQELNLT
eukprot:403348728